MGGSFRKASASRCDLKSAIVFDVCSCSVFLVVDVFVVELIYMWLHCFPFGFFVSG